MRPSSTTERRPPTSAATTGVPHAAASSATRPNDSVREGTSTRRRRGSTRRATRGSAGRRTAPGPRGRAPATMDVQPGELGGAVGPARAADDHEPGPRVAQRGQRLHREVDALERLDPADEQQRRAGRRAAGGAGRRPGRRARRRRGRRPAGMTSTRRGRRRRSARAGRVRRRRGDESRRSGRSPPRTGRGPRGRRRCRLRLSRGSSVWNVVTSGRSSSCFSRCPTAPETQ